DFQHRTLFLGNGLQRNSGVVSSEVVNVAGTGTSSVPPAGPVSDLGTSVGIASPGRMASAPDGSIYFVDTDADRVYRLARDGHLTAVAGDGVHGYGGDGGPAIEAHLKS